MEPETLGTPDPFCSLWPSFNGLMESEVPIQFAVRTLDDELLQYAPDDLIDAVEDQLVARYASLGTPVPSDYREDDADAANICAPNGWVREHCSAEDEVR